MSNIYRLTAATERSVGSQFAKSAEARYQEGLDRDDARESAIARVQTELRIAMLAALGGINQWVAQLLQRHTLRRPARELDQRA